jgi:hypothetical protein
MSFSAKLICGTGTREDSASPLPKLAIKHILSLHRIYPVPRTLKEFRKTEQLTVKGFIHKSGVPLIVDCPR